jgi:urease accessory protein
MGAASPSLLLLADARFPSGGHAHSGGLEPAAELEGVRDLASLELFLRGRLTTAGLVGAAFAAAACRSCAERVDAAACELLDAELDARIPSPALRAASRRLGRQLLRAGRMVWPDPWLEQLARLPGRGLHQPVALGAVAAAAGLGPEAASLAVAHDAVVGPASAAVRLLGLDPFAVHALLARLGPDVADVAAEAARRADDSPEDLPACAGPLLDVSAERHAAWEVRLFAS